MSDANGAVTDFKSKIAARLPALKREYQRGVNRDLSRHSVEGVFGRQTVNVISILLNDSSGILLELQAEAVTIPDSEQIAYLDAQKDALVDYALNFQRSSCALSNFPDEHNPNTDYFSQVLSDVDTLWKTWCVAHQHLPSIQPVPIGNKP